MKEESDKSVDQQSQTTTKKENEDAGRPDGISEISEIDGAKLIKRKITLSVSYLEIYNESVNDLLDPTRKNLEVREHKGEVQVERLTTRKITSLHEIQNLLAEGDKVRIFAETRMNSKSSRSHTVF